MPLSRMSIRIRSQFYRSPPSLSLLRGGSENPTSKEKPSTNVAPPKATKKPHNKPKSKKRSKRSSSRKEKKGRKTKPTLKAREREHSDRRNSRKRPRRARESFLRENSTKPKHKKRRKGPSHSPSDSSSDPIDLDQPSEGEISILTKQMIKSLGRRHRFEHLKNSDFPKPRGFSPRSVLRPGQILLSLAQKLESSRAKTLGKPTSVPSVSLA